MSKTRLAKDDDGQANRNILMKLISVDTTKHRSWHSINRKQDYYWYIMYAIATSDRLTLHAKLQTCLNTNIICNIHL